MGKAITRLCGVLIPTAAVMVLASVEIADARGVRGGGGGSVRGGGGGGFRGGGGGGFSRGGGGYGGGRSYASSRPSGGARGYASARPSGGASMASRPGAGGSGTYRGYSAGTRPSTRPGAGGAGTRGDRTNVAGGNRGNRNYTNRGDNRWNNGNINVGNDIDVDVDNGWNGCCGGDWDYHPVAAGVAFGTAAAITSAAVGSYVYSLPPSCGPVPYAGYTYYNCSGTWYQPQYEGSSVTYVTVNPPY
jgi:hypothetical protein